MNRMHVIIAILISPLPIVSAQGDEKPVPRSGATDHGLENVVLRLLLKEARTQTKAIETEVAKKPGHFPPFDPRNPRRLINSTLQSIGNARATVGDSEAARATYRAAINLASTLENAAEKADALLENARTMAESADPKEARTALQSATQAARAIPWNDPELATQLETLNQSPAEAKSLTLIKLAGIQAKLGDRSDAESTFRQAREAAETVTDDLPTIKSLIAVSIAEDSAGMPSHWSQLLERALVPKRDYQRADAVELLLQARVKAGGSLGETLRIVDKALHGDLRTFALWVVADEVAFLARQGERRFDGSVKPLAEAAKYAEFDSDAKKDKVLSRVAELLARTGDGDAALQLLDLLTSGDPVRKQAQQTRRLAVLRDFAQFQFRAGHQAAARKTLDRALALIRTSSSAYDVQAELSELLIKIGERDAGMRLVSKFTWHNLQAEAYANAAAALYELGDRSGARTAFEQARHAADLVPDDILWGTLRGWRDSEQIREVFWKIDNESAFSQRNDALRSIAVAQARTGDLASAFGSVGAMTNANEAPDPSLPESEAAIREIVAVQVAADDFAGAWATATRLPSDDAQWYNATRPLLQSIARRQSESGDAVGALESCLKHKTSAAKLVALQGLADGIARKYAFPTKPRASPNLTP